MARDLNKVQLTGRLGADPTMRNTPQGSTITTFRVASNRSWRSSSGASHEETEWFRIVAWDQLAEECRSLSKGAHIYIEGRLQTRQWAEADGQTRLTAEVIASEIIVLADRPAPPGKQSDPPDPRARHSRRARPARPPADLAGSSPVPPLTLNEEDLPI